MRKLVPLPIKITESRNAFHIRDGAGLLICWCNYGVEPMQAAAAKLQTRDKALELAKFIARSLTDQGR
jgi:hypothetical protein